MAQTQGGHPVRVCIVHESRRFACTSKDVPVLETLKVAASKQYEHKWATNTTEIRKLGDKGKSKEQHAARHYQTLKLP